jgi:hypothetical protein
LRKITAKESRHKRHGGAGEIEQPESSICSRYQRVHHVSVHVGESEVAARHAVGQLFVIEAQQLQDSRVQVVDVHPVLHGLEAEFVGGPVHLATFHPATGEPHREAPVVMVAAVDLARIGARGR